MAGALRETPNREKLSRIEGANVMEDGRYMPPPADQDGKTWVRTSALIQATTQDCYSLWRNHTAAPLWQEQITEVRVTGETTSHWVMDVKGTITEWDTEVMADEPGKRIAWRSIGGDSANAGEVVFEEAPGGRGTIVSVSQEFGQGKLKTITDTVVNRNPKQAVIENLRHFKAFIETGEIPTNQGQPHGPRGAVGSIKATAYGEHIETPLGSQQRKAS